MSDSDTKLNSPPDPDLDNLVAETLSGQSYLKAWSAVVQALMEVAPEAFADKTKSPVENVCNWIRGQRHE